MEQRWDNHGGSYQTPAAPPAAPAWQPPAAPATPPPAPAAPPAAPAPVSGIDRAGYITSINSVFEQNPKYKDFMLIISVMKEASAPTGKTSINDFSDDELVRLYQLVTQP